MGEARARALYAWKNSVNSRRDVTPPADILFRWRKAHPKGRTFSCYQRDFKATAAQVARYLQARGQAMLDAAGLTKQPKRRSAADLMGGAGGDR